MKRKAKKILAMAVVVMSVFSLFGCKAKKKVADTQQSIPAQAACTYTGSDNAPVLSFELTALKTQPREKGGVVTASYLLRNALAELSLTKVVLTIDYLDEDGKVLHTEKVERLYRVAPLAPGEERKASFGKSMDCYDKVRSVSVTIDAVATEQEIKPYAPPVPDRYLFAFYNDEEKTAFCENFYTDTPVKLQYFKANKQESETADPEIIKAVFEALKQVKIGQEANLGITDSEIYYTFVMADGRSVSVTFESQGLLHYNGKNYNVLENGGVFKIAIPE